MDLILYIFNQFPMFPYNNLVSLNHQKCVHTLSITCGSTVPHDFLFGLFLLVSLISWHVCPSSGPMPSSKQASARKPGDTHRTWVTTQLLCFQPMCISMTDFTRHCFPDCGKPLVFWQGISLVLMRMWISSCHNSSI